MCGKKAWKAGKLESWKAGKLWKTNFKIYKFISNIVLIFTYKVHFIIFKKKNISVCSEPT